MTSTLLPKHGPFAGKWALVTGASRGVGHQIALALSREGCNLVLHSRSQEHTERVEAEILAEGGMAVALEARLEDASAVRELARQAQEVSGGVDILYNNAGLMTAYHTQWLEAVPEEYERSFQVNVIAPILLANALLPSMLQRGWGRVVNVTSGIRDEPELQAYACSKAALDKYVLDTAPKLLGTGVTMNLLDPGWLRTDLGGPQAPGAVESVLPGALVPVFATDGKSGVLTRAQEHAQA